MDDRRVAGRLLDSEHERKCRLQRTRCSSKRMRPCASFDSGLRVEFSGRSGLQQKGRKRRRKEKKYYAPLNTRGDDSIATTF